MANSPIADLIRKNSENKTRSSFTDPEAMQILTEVRGLTLEAIGLELRDGIEGRWSNEDSKEFLSSLDKLFLGSVIRTKEKLAATVLFLENGVTKHVMSSVLDSEGPLN